MSKLEQARKLKAQAELMRRAAKAPTTGGALTDKLLLQMAIELQRKAIELEAAADG